MKKFKMIENIAFSHILNIYELCDLIIITEKFYAALVVRTDLI